MKTEDAAPITQPASQPQGRSRLLSRAVALVGLAGLCYVLGAAVMYFGWPSSALLRKAFLGAEVWISNKPVPPGRQPQPPIRMVLSDVAAKTFDGYTLYAWATMDDSSTQAFLIDMRGQVVHRWQIPFSRIWPKPPHLEGDVTDDLVCFFACHLYPNGDLLVVLHGTLKQANGFGLVRLDKDSNVVWKYAAHIHHDVQVGEDGTIYAIQHEMVQQMPRGLEAIRPPCLVDSLVRLSPDGKLLGEPLPILEAFRDSPYAVFLQELEQPPGSETTPQSGPKNLQTLEEQQREHDALHTNSVQPLGTALAAKFPQFKPGQMLISIRHLDAVAVVDPTSRKVVWAAQGPWKFQHDAQFLENGHLLIFDNRGLPHRSRVLEYDPQTQSFPWSYAGEKSTPFYTSERGMSQRLPNGNTLIVDSEGGEIREVTLDKEVVWAYSTGRRFITTARRYPANQLQFLKGDTRAR